MKHLSFTKQLAGVTLNIKKVALKGSSHAEKNILSRSLEGEETGYNFQALKDKEGPQDDSHSVQTLLYLVFCVAIFTQSRRLLLCHCLKQHAKTGRDGEGKAREVEGGEKQSVKVDGNKDEEGEDG